MLRLIMENFSFGDDIGVVEGDGVLVVWWFIYDSL